MEAFVGLYNSIRLFRVDEAVKSFEMTTFGSGIRVSLDELLVGLHPAIKTVVKVRIK
jgi:hypothetical protein